MFLRYRLRALALAFGIVSLVPVASASAAPQSRTFGWDTVTQQFTVPAGVNQVHLDAWGGSGGSGGLRAATGASTRRPAGWVPGSTPTWR